MRVVVAFACSLAMGCGSSAGGDSVDAGLSGDAGPLSGDGAAGGMGLTFALVPVPSVPGGLLGGDDVDVPASGDALVIEELDLRLEVVRAIGDAAAGGSETTLSEIELVWGEPGATQIRFPGAPPGTYSYLRGRVDRFQMKGSAALASGISGPLEVSTGEAIGVDLDIDLGEVELPAGGGLRVDIAVDLNIVVDGVDWDAAVHDDEIEIEHDDEQIALILANLAAAFRVR